jgi:hypothetical protein
MEGPDNPYAALPRMVLMTYQLPDAIREIAMQGEFNEFDLNVFFSAEGVGDQARFKYEDEVQKWLDLIRGAYLPTSMDNLRLGAQKPPLPFSDVRLLNVLSHTLWFLPSVASCYAMRNLLAKRQNRFYHDYKSHCRRGQRRRDRRCRIAASAGGNGRSPQDENHHADLRQTDHRGHGSSLDRHLYAAEFFQPGNLFPGRLSCAESVGHQKSRWRIAQ